MSCTCPIIAALDPAIPIMRHGRAMLSGMAGSGGRVKPGVKPGHDGFR